MMRNKIDLEHDKVEGLFFKYFLPTVSAMMVTGIYIVFDGIFVGKGVGSDGLAAVNTVIPFFSIVSGIGLMFGIGASTICYIKIARKDFEDANKVFSLSLKALIAIILAISIVFIIFAYQMASALKVSTEILEDAIIYFRIIALYGVIFASNTYLGFFVRLEGAPKVAMVSMITGALINIVLDYIFIFIFGFGVMGAALATGLGSLVSLIIRVIYLYNKSEKIKYIKTKIELKIISYVCKIGLAALLAEYCLAATIIVYNYMLTTIGGKDLVAAYGIINFIHPLLMLIFLAIGQSIQPIVSFNYGLGKITRIKKSLKLALKYAIGFGIVFTFIGYFIPEAIVSMFIESDSIVFDYAVEVLPIYYLSYLFLGINMVVVSYYQSTEEIAKSVAITLLRGFILVSILAVILTNYFGYKGIFWAVPISEILAILLILVMYRSKKGVVILEEDGVLTTKNNL